MTNPFNKTPSQTAPTQTPAPAGYNPFAGADQAGERSPLMGGDVTARGKVLAYRVVPKTPKTSTYVYVDLELLEVAEGQDLTHKPGAKVSHRIGGFESTARDKALMSLNQLNFAIAPEMRAKVDAGELSLAQLPMLLQESSDIVGREIWIKTKPYTTQSVDASTGQRRVIVKGEYYPVENETK